MRELRAGPLRMELHGADLRYIRLGRREVVRRVYVAVRDARWGTVPAQVSDLHVAATASAFTVTFRCRHRQEAVDFVWDGTVNGTADGTVRYEMRGRAESTFERSRIGICVLHPIETCAGAPFRVQHPDGSIEEGTLPRLIAPHQPVFDITKLSYPVADDGKAELLFEGDVFEMEDQRNWTDASFKTYSTPLRLPTPLEIQRGTEISQAVTLQVRTAAGRVEEEASAVVEIAVLEEEPARLPALGLGLGPDPVSDESRQRLLPLRLAHLRVDLPLAGNQVEPALDLLRDAAELARSADAGLEVALHLGSEPDGALDAIRSLVDSERIPVVRWLIFDQGEATSSGASLSRARERLSGTAPIGGGAETHFTELNRRRPALDALDLVCYPVMPQAHAFDELSIVETLAGQAETVASARAFVGGLPLAITPISLRARPRPGAPVERWPSEDPRSANDPRQRTDFLAAWTLASVATLAEAGVESATYFEASGPRGVMAADGRPYPVYEAFAALSSFAGAAVMRTSSTNPLAARALCLRDARRQRLLLANLTDAPRLVRLRGVPPYARLQEILPKGGAVADGFASEERELRLAPFAIYALDCDRT
ncbi:MAG: hypothetical protein JO023_29240 [Chloroflexi bacterium]|nr:hypothetical protein [Chloroflexota bacterium]